MKKRGTIYWYTTLRTKGTFLSSLKDRLSIIEHSDKKDDYSKNTVVRAVQIFLFLKRRNITHIIVDGFSKEVLIVSVFAKYLNVKIIIRVRGGMNGEYLDSIFFNQKIIREIKNFYFILIRNTILRKSYKIITVSVFGKSQILYELPFIPSNKIHVLIKPTIFNVNAHEVQTSKELIGLCEHANIITTVTSFRYFRKYDAILHYHKSILNVLYNNSQWYWLIAGNGSGVVQVEKELIASAYELGIESQIRFLGFVKEIPTLLASTDIFYYPTFRDTAPQALKESQIVGLPVLVNRSSCGAVEFIPPGTDCQKQIFEGRGELEIILQELINSETSRRRLGDCNKDFAIRNYASEVCASKFFQILECK